MRRTNIYKNKEFKKAINNFMGDPKLIKEFTLTKLRLLKYSLLGNRKETRELSKDSVKMRTFLKRELKLTFSIYKDRV